MTAAASMISFAKIEIFEEVEAAALKRAVTMKLAAVLVWKNMKQTAIAKRVRTPRAALDREWQL